MSEYKKTVNIICASLGTTEIFVQDGERVMLTVSGTFLGAPDLEVAEREGWEIDTVFPGSNSNFCVSKHTDIPLEDVENYPYDEIMDSFLCEVEDKMRLIPAGSGEGACTSSSWSVGYSQEDLKEGYVV